MVAGDSGVKKGGRECDKVIRSLTSGFPNEVDFALNVLTVMSFEKPESVPIAKVMLGVWGPLAVCALTCTTCCSLLLYTLGCTQCTSVQIIIVCINQSF